MDKPSNTEDLKCIRIPKINAIQITLTPNIFTSDTDYIKKTINLSKLVDKLKMSNIIITIPECEFRLITNIHKYTSKLIHKSLKSSKIDNCLIISEDKVYQQIFSEEIDMNSFLKFFSSMKGAINWLERYQA